MCQNRDFGQNHDFPKRLLFCSGENQMPNFLKIAANSRRAVVFCSKAAAHTSLIRNTNADHKVRGYVGIMKFLYTAKHGEKFF